MDTSRLVDYVNLLLRVLFLLFTYVGGGQKLLHVKPDRNTKVENDKYNYNTGQNYPFCKQEKLGLRRY